MSYTPNEWVTGNIITAQKLNHIEQGVDGMSTESYVPTEWVTGDVITAEKLNHIEQGIVNGSCGGDTIIAPEQSVTTAVKLNPQDYYIGVITTSPGWEYDEDLGIPINWTVAVNGVTVPYDSEEGLYTSPEVSTSETRYSVWFGAYSEGQNGIILEVLEWDEASEEWTTVEATATVSIIEPASGPEYLGGIGSDYIVVAPKQTVTTDETIGDEKGAIITLADGYSFYTSLGLPTNYSVFINGYMASWSSYSDRYELHGNYLPTESYYIVGYEADSDSVVLRVLDDQGSTYLEETVTVTILQPASGPIYGGGR